MKAVVIIVLVAAFSLLGFHEWRLTQQVEALRQAQQALGTQQQEAEANLDKATAQWQRARAAQAAPARIATPPAVAQTDQARVLALEKQVQTLTDTLTRRGFTLAVTAAVPEYDPTQPPPPEPVADTTTNAPAKRSWGPEQAIGAPDTPVAGDCSTAWTAREQDAGPEWLSVAFAQAVDIAEVRVRETYNPGAIIKVAAMVNNQEIVLWEGQSARGAAPRDFVVRSSAGVQAQFIIIHQDTASVPGWNEIDAVELVGRDGTRQWAASASASSSYADRSTGTTGLILDGSGRTRPPR